MSKGRKVIVGMSGGVDSSVAAAILKERGFDVMGVFIKVWSDPDIPCTQQEDRLDALRVAIQLGIPFEVWDLTKEYKDKVVDYMVESYKKGITPNPDVMCNKYIKFGLFLKNALRRKVDFIATGHYVRKVEKKKTIGSKGDKIYALKVAKDINKDQSYFLWTLNQAQISKCIFPIGDYLKSEVRKIAEDLKLVVSKKKDSQGICFLGKVDVNDFLKKYIKPNPGPIKLISGQKIGQHNGLYFFTIGQRKGINLPNGPYFVVDKDITNNTLIVSRDEKDLFKKEVVFEKVNWISEPPKKFPFKVLAKPRYLAESSPGLLIKESKDFYRFIFEKPQRALSPGQSIVFYKEDELLGGGIIV
jgi:tRNA-specific 2-thiouridylase